MLWPLLLVSAPPQPMLRLDRRIVANAAAYLTATTEALAAKSKCPRCFMHASLCVCSETEKVASQHKLDLDSFPRFECRVVMHYKEFGRPSNTGKFLPMLMPDHSSIAIYCTEECHQSIEFMIENNAVVLFPETDSTELNPQTLPVLFPNNSKVNVLCVLDSTWNEAKTMNKWIPRSIPRAHLAEGALMSGESLYRVRKQASLGSDKTTLSTIEAAGAALDTIQGTSKFSVAFTEVLKYSVDAVFKQRGYKQVYGHAIQPNMSNASSSHDCFTRATVQRPKACPKCKQTSRFKNLGSASLDAEMSADGGVCRRWRCKDCGLIFVNSTAYV